MRGLEARCALAMFRVLEPINRDAAESALRDADHEAQRTGMNDREDGVDTPPAMFKDEPLLLESWSYGQAWSAECVDMRDCPGCHNPAWDWDGVCPTHG